MLLNEGNNHVQEILANEKLSKTKFYLSRCSNSVLVEVTKKYISGC